MSNQISKRKNKFYCPFCQVCLWRVGSRKYPLFFPGKLNKNCLDISDRSLSAQQAAHILKNIWIEEFFCQKHGKMWMLVSKAHDTLTAVPALEQDWSRTAQTINPDLPDSPVQNYELMSRLRTANRRTG